MKTFFVLVCVVAAFAAGVYIGRLPITDLVLGSRAAPLKESSAPGATQKQGSDSPTSANSATEGSVVVSGAQLSAGQRELLTKLGIDADAIVVTPAMVACAEAKLGASRLAEIQSGATPTFTEGASLLACYR